MAYTDVFEFISTRLDPPKSPSNIRDSIRFLPTIPADIRPSFDADLTQGKIVKKTPEKSLADTLSLEISKLPDNLPAYQYTEKQERRYSNPFFQYTPYKVYGKDIEDLYGTHQGSGEKIWNSFVKFGANVLGTFSSSYLSIPHQIDLIRSGKHLDLFKEDSMFSWIQQGLINLEDKFPNYYTEWEREHPYLSALPFSGGAANFWGDKVLKNIGFSIGGLAAGLTQDALLTAFTGGVGSSAAFIHFANQIKKFKPELFRGFRQLAKSDNIDEVVQSARTGRNFSKGLEVSSLSNLNTASRYALTTYLSAQGEAFIEGYHTYLDTKKDLLENAIYGRFDDKLDEVEQLSQDSARYTTGINLPILMASNFVQFHNLLAGKKLLGETIPKSFIRYETTDQGLQAVSDFTLKKGLRKWAAESIKSPVMEGFEEGSQYHISNSLHDYYVDRLNPSIRQELAEYVLSEIPESLTDKHFWEESFLGAISGFLMGSPVLARKIIEGKSRYETIASVLNKKDGSIDRFNSLVRNFTTTINLNNPISDKQISGHDGLFGVVHDSLRFGTFDTFIDSLSELKDLDINNYNQAFGQEFQSLEERDSFIDSLIEESYNMRSDIIKINRAFLENPYTTSPLLKRLNQAFSPKSEAELENLQEALFTSFKEVAARNESLLRKTKGVILGLKDSLKTFGFKDESLEYIKNLGVSPRGLPQYIKWKKSQIKDLKRQVDYYEELSSVDTGIQSDIDPKQQLRYAKQSLEKTQVYIETLSDLYEKLVANPKDVEVQKEINNLVLKEETTEGERKRYQLQKEKEILELLKQYQKKTTEEESLEQEQEDIEQDVPKTAEQLIDVHELHEEIVEPLVETAEVPSIPTIQSDWLSKYNEGSKIQKNKNWYTVIGKTEDSLIVKDSLDIKYSVRKEKNKFIFTPLGPEGFIEDVEQVIPVGNIDEDVELSAKLIISDQVFSPEEIGNYPDTVWISIEHGLNNGTPVYTIEQKDGDIIIRKRKIQVEMNTPVIGEQAKTYQTIEQFTNTPFIKKTKFKQILRGEELPVSQKTKIITEENKQYKNLDIFLGENTSLKEILQTQIDKNKIEIICK